MDTQKRREARICFLLLFYLICSVLEFHGPNNGTTLRYSFSLWVQPTNTNVKIIPLQNRLKYTHTQSLSLSQTPKHKTHCSQTYTHPLRQYSHTHSLAAHVFILRPSHTHHVHPPIYNRIHSQEEKKNSQL